MLTNTFLRRFTILNLKKANESVYLTVVINQNHLISIDLRYVYLDLTSPLLHVPLVTATYNTSANEYISDGHR